MQWMVEYLPQVHPSLSVFPHILYFSTMLCLVMRRWNVNTELSNPIGLPQPVSESMFRTCRVCLLQISPFTKESTPLGVAIKEIYLATNNLGCCLLWWSLLVSSQTEWNWVWSSWIILKTRHWFVRKGSFEAKTEIRRYHVWVRDKKQKIRPGMASTCGYTSVSWG